MVFRFLFVICLMTLIQCGHEQPKADSATQAGTEAVASQAEPLTEKDLHGQLAQLLKKSNDDLQRSKDMASRISKLSISNSEPQTQELISMYEGTSEKLSKINPMIVGLITEMATGNPENQDVQLKKTADELEKDFLILSERLDKIEAALTQAGL